MFSKKLLAAATLTVAVAQNNIQPVHGWHSVGHKTVAAIAFATMENEVAKENLLNALSYFPPMVTVCVYSFTTRSLNIKYNNPFFFFFLTFNY